MRFPVLTILLVLPLGGAIVAAWMRDRHAARQVGTSVAWATLVLALGVALAFDTNRGGTQLLEMVFSIGGREGRPMLGLDALAVPLLPLTALVTLAIFVGAPRSHIHQDSVAPILMMTCATLGLLVARNLGVLAVCWVGTLLPGLVRLMRLPAKPGTALVRSYILLLVFTSVPLITAIWLLGVHGWQSHLGAPLDLDELAGLGTAIEAQPLIFWLILFAVAVRIGVVPFHSWLPVFLERGPTGVTTLLLGLPTALFVAARLMVLVPDAAAAGLPYIADGALVGALVGALLALAENDLKRMIGYIAASQSGLVLVGFASLNTQSVSGALMQSMGVGLATSSLYLIVRAIEARSGTTDVRYLGGLVARVPRASALFFVFAVAVAGFPGSPGFVGEDLLLHGVLSAHPIVATMMVLVTALNAITLLRAFMRAFLGRPQNRGRTEGPLPIEDLLPRERQMALGLAAVLLIAGLVPGPLLAIRDEAVRALVRDRDTTQLGRAHETFRARHHEQ